MVRALASTIAATVVTTVASAATVDLGAIDSRAVVITGTTAITSFGAGRNREYLLRFANALTLTNGTNLVLPGGVDITTAAGDTCMATSDASGVWRVWYYQRARGGLVTGQSRVRADATGTVAAAPFGDFGGNGQFIVSGLANTDLRLAMGVATADAGTPVVLQGIYAGVGALTIALQPSGGKVAVRKLSATYDLDVAGTFGVSGVATFGAAIAAASFTVGTLPAGAAGQVIYVTNARKVGEASGAGSGVISYFSNGSWRRPSDDTALAA